MISLPMTKEFSKPINYLPITRLKFGFDLKENHTQGQVNLVALKQVTLNEPSHTANPNYLGLKLGLISGA